MSLEAMISSALTRPDEDLCALVLIGGGARTAYQVGVLQAIGNMLNRTHGPATAFPFRVLVGTSAGALNATFLASRAHDGLEAFAHLAACWSALRQLPREIAAVMPYRPVDILAIAPTQSIDTLASYPLFEPGFVNTLIALGKRDACTRQDELLAFFRPGIAVDQPAARCHNLARFTTKKSLETSRKIARFLPAFNTAD